MLFKESAFTTITALTLALGIGATSAVFSMIQGVLLTPPPYDHPERLALLAPVRPDGQPLQNAPGWPAAQGLEWQKEAKSLEALADYTCAFNFAVSSDGSE